ncbi:hypothetical protein VTI28DRAFT_5985 [Corynascus sepedonium]
MMPFDSKVLLYCRPLPAVSRGSCQPGSLAKALQTADESRRFCTWRAAIGTRPSLGIAGRNAAGECHFSQELRSCGSDKWPTTACWDQLGPPEVSRRAQIPQFAPDSRPLTAPGEPQENLRNRRDCPQASRILRRDI